MTNLFGWVRWSRTWMAVMAVVICWPVTVAAQVDDPALQQVVEADGALVSGFVELRTGHVDLAPRFVDGTWRLLVYDTTVQPPVWRDPADVVLRVGEAGRADAPADPTYRFLGATAGAPVWVIPQTENPGVVWLGWNTQHPEVVERVDRGVRLRLAGLEGPGTLSVYLQSGNLSGPEVLWSSAEPQTEPFWAETATHTHANWVFTEPGRYMVRLEASARLRDGSEVSTTADVTVAVGDEVVVAPGATRFGGRVIEAADSQAALGRSPDQDARRSVPGGWLMILLTGVAGAVVALIAVTAARSTAARRRIFGGR